LSITNNIKNLLDIQDENITWQTLFGSMSKMFVGECVLFFSSFIQFEQ